MKGITNYRPTGWEAEAYEKTDKLAKHILEEEKKFSQMTLNPKPFTRTEVKTLSRR